MKRKIYGLASHEEHLCDLCGEGFKHGILLVTLKIALCPHCTEAINQFYTMFLSDLTGIPKTIDK